MNQLLASPCANCFTYKWIWFNFWLKIFICICIISCAWGWYNSWVQWRWLFNNLHIVVELLFFMIFIIKHQFGMAHLWECSPPTNVPQVWFSHLAPYVGSVFNVVSHPCCEGFLIHLEDSRLIICKFLFLISFPLYPHPTVLVQRLETVITVSNWNAVEFLFLS